MMSSWDFSRLSRLVRDVRMESFQVSAILELCGLLKISTPEEQRNVVEMQEANGLFVKLERKNVGQPLRH